MPGISRDLQEAGAAGWQGAGRGGEELRAGGLQALGSLEADCKDMGFPLREMGAPAGIRAKEQHLNSVRKGCCVKTRLIGVVGVQEARREAGNPVDSSP